MTEQMDHARPAWAIVAAALAEGRPLPTVRALAQEAGVRTAVAAAVLRRVRGEAADDEGQERGRDVSEAQAPSVPDRCEATETVAVQPHPPDCEAPLLGSGEAGGPFHHAWPPAEDRRAAQAVAWRVLWRRAPLAMTAVLGGWAVVHWASALLSGHVLLAWLGLRSAHR